MATLIPLRRSERLANKNKINNITNSNNSNDTSSNEEVLRRSTRLQERNNTLENSDREKRSKQFIHNMKKLMYKGQIPAVKNKDYLNMATFFECVYRNRDLLNRKEFTNFIISTNNKCKEFIEIIEKKISNIEDFAIRSHSVVYTMFPYTIANMFGVTENLDKLGFDILNSGIVRLYVVTTKLRKYLKTELSME